MFRSAGRNRRILNVEFSCQTGFAIDFEHLFAKMIGSDFVGELMARASVANKFKSVFAVLEKEFGRREKYSTHVPVRQALVTVLLKDGKECSAERIIRKLENEFVDWNEVRVCDPEMLDSMLGAGFPKGTGKLICDTLTAIFNHSQAMNLDDVMSLPAEQAQQKLRRLAPMPSRVMGELLLAGLGYKKLPETPGLLRAAKRLGFLNSGNSESQVKVLRKLVAPPMTSRAFHVFELLAERFCLNEGTVCETCPVCGHCPTGADKAKKLKAQHEREQAARLAAEKQKKEEKSRHAGKLREALRLHGQKLTVRKSHPRAKPAIKQPQMMQASSADVRPSLKKRRTRSRHGAALRRARR